MRPVENDRSPRRSGAWDGVLEGQLDGAGLTRVQLTPIEFYEARSQKQAERLLEAMEHAGTGLYRLSDEERRLVDEGLAECLRGDLVPDDEMEAFFGRHAK